MLKLDRIGVSEGIYVNKTLLVFFFSVDEKFQLDVYNECHDVLMMPMNLGIMPF